MAKQKKTILGLQTEVKVKGWLNFLQSRTQMVRLKKPFPKRKRKKWNVVGTSAAWMFLTHIEQLSESYISLPKHRMFVPVGKMSMNH